MGHLSGKHCKPCHAGAACVFAGVFLTRDAVARMKASLATRVASDVTEEPAGVSISFVACARLAPVASSAQVPPVAT